MVMVRVLDAADDMGLDFGLPWHIATSPCIEAIVHRRGRILDAIVFFAAIASALIWIVQIMLLR